MGLLAFVQWICGWWRWLISAGRRLRPSNTSTNATGRIDTGCAKIFGPTLVDGLRSPRRRSSLPWRSDHLNQRHSQTTALCSAARAPSSACRSRCGSRRTWASSRPPWMVAMMKSESSSTSTPSSSCSASRRRPNPFASGACQRSNASESARRAGSSRSASWPTSEPIGHRRPRHGSCTPVRSGRTISRFRRSNRDLPGRRRWHRARRRPSNRPLHVRGHRDRRSSGRADCGPPPQHVRPRRGSPPRLRARGPGPLPRPGRGRGSFGPRRRGLGSRHDAEATSATVVLYRSVHS